MSGRCSRSVSRVTPQFVITWGLKLSTSTSNFGIMRQNIALPRGCVTSSVMARLFRLTLLYMPLVLMPVCGMSALRTAGGTGEPAPRQTSGRRTVSICTTSAPSNASSSVQNVPAQAWVKHSTRTPARGWPACWGGEGSGGEDQAACAPSFGADRCNSQGVSESLATGPGAATAWPSTVVFSMKPRALNCSLSRSSRMFCTTPEMQRRLARPWKMSHLPRCAEASTRPSRTGRVSCWWRPQALTKRSSSARSSRPRKRIADVHCCQSP